MRDTSILTRYGWNDTKLKVLDLFAGIGGFTLGLEKTCMKLSLFVSGKALAKRYSLA
jgi:hypothetical protein